MIRLLLPTLLLCTLAWAGAPEREELLQPFTGFDEEGMKPLFSLFRADPEGRLLLRKAWKKLKFSGASDLDRILCFCDSRQLGGYRDRRGLFIQESAGFYRAKNEREWKPVTRGALEKLNNPEKYPVIDQKEWSTRNFHHMETAFLPKICLRKGLSVLQTYLVLYHELTHLVGSEPFQELDLFGFSNLRMEQEFYFRELERPGGEMAAFLAQMKAFQRLKDRHGFPAQTVLESFLTEKGRLVYREKKAFLSHLLYEANYKQHLDEYLAQQIVFQYNRAQSWWEFLDRYLVQLDNHLDELDEKIQEVDRFLTEAKKKGGASERVIRSYRKAREELAEARLENRRTYHLYELEQKESIDLMVRIDKRHPE